MPTSARREPQRSATPVSDRARDHGRGASRTPPGPALPQMAPSPDLVTLQCKMQEHAPRGLPLLPPDLSAPPKSPPRALPEGIRTSVEQLAHVPMDDVRVFPNSDKPAEVQADAITQATDIHLGPGQDKHLAHEAWHVAQNKQKRVDPGEPIGEGVTINKNQGLEKEADDKAVEIERMASSRDLPAESNGPPAPPMANSPSNAPIQRKINLRLPVKPWRKQGGSQSQVVNDLIEQYNAIEETSEKANIRLRLLAQIDKEVFKASTGKDQIKWDIHVAVDRERRIVESGVRFVEIGHSSAITDSEVVSRQNLLAEIRESPRRLQGQDARVAERQPAQSRRPLPPQPVVEPEPEHAPNTGGPIALGPLISMAELAQCENAEIRALCGNTTFNGPLMGVLLGAFEANWFKAKDCLVFSKWPAGVHRRFSHTAALALMQALTNLRGNVHTEIKRRAHIWVHSDLTKRANQIKAFPDLILQIRKENRNLQGDDQVKYLGSVGADSVTSDVDVSTGGENSEIAVASYNAAFREAFGVRFDPGTVFDLNVYAKDFIHGSLAIVHPDRVDLGVAPENPYVELGEAATKEQEREQEIWSLVHIARYMSDQDWDGFVLYCLAGLPDARRETEAELFDTARSRSKGFHERLTSTMEHLGKQDEEQDAHAPPRASSWADGDEHHFAEDALRMRAANRLYEEKLLQVKILRARIGKLKAIVGPTPAQVQELETSVKNLSSEISMAQLYANEVYGSGGATVHAVYGMQTKKKLVAQYQKPVRVHMSPSQWLQAFNDNIGDVMKDYLHFATAHGVHQPDYWYAAFKMGKYVNRVLDCLDGIIDAEWMSVEDAAEIRGSGDYRELKTLANRHVSLKDGIGGTDPKELARDSYFGKMNAMKVGTIKAAVMTLGADVRRKIKR
jgi:Domain of unknown function (DUF4157)